MKAVRLGQAGLWFESGGTKILVDPYFTDSAFAVSGVHRKSDPPAWVWDLKPDILLITHDHTDHYDPGTVSHFVNGNTAVTVLSPRSVWEKIRACGGKNNFVLVSPGVAWTQGDTCITVCGAKHSDPYAVGYALETGGRKIYITGDTLYYLNMLIPFESADYVFLPINGAGNNMNAADAAKLAKLYGAKRAVPVHYGLLDGMTPDCFEYPGKFVMEDYAEYEI